MRDPRTFPLAVLCVAAGALFGQDEPLYFDRAPYLQSLSSSSVIVKSESSVACNAAIMFGPPGAMALLATESAPSYRHEFRIAGLAPGSEYEYRVFHGATVFAARRFTTLPEEGADALHAIDFAVIGDSGYRDGAGNPPQLALAAELQRRSGAFDFMLHMGDVVTPGTMPLSAQDRYFSVYEAMLGSVCVFPVIGNHDCFGGDCSPWTDMFATPGGDGWPQEACYSFDAGNAHFTVLDTTSEQGIDAQVQWLRQDLAGADRPWKIVLLHRPPYGTGKHGPATDVAERVVGIFEDLGVDIVFSGHNHAYERMHPISAGAACDAWQYPDFISPRGILYVTSGGGGAPTYPVTDFQCAHLSALYLPVVHFLEVRITLGQLDVAAIDASGAVIDEFSLRKDLPRPAFRFLRGDVNDNGDVGLGDVITTLTFLFARTKDLCRAAGDANADGNVDIADAVHTLRYLFARGAPPPAPFPLCGDAGNVDETGCVVACP